MQHTVGIRRDIPKNFNVRRSGADFAHDIEPWHQGFPVDENSKRPAALTSEARQACFTEVRFGKMKTHLINARLEWNVIAEHSLTPALVEPLLASSQNEIIAYLDDTSAGEVTIAQPGAPESVSESSGFQTGQNTDGFPRRCSNNPRIHRRGGYQRIAAMGEPSANTPTRINTAAASRAGHQ